jgi:hypothetical protein
MAASLLGACSFDQVRGAFTPTPPATTVISTPVPAKTQLRATVFLETPSAEVTQALTPALSSGRYSLTSDSTLAVFHVSATPQPGVGEESTSAPLMGILRRSTRTDTYEIPFVVKDATGRTLHNGNVIGFGEEDAGIYPRATSANPQSASKAKADAIAQLPAAVLETLDPLPWQAAVIGPQDAKTVMLGIGKEAGVAPGQMFTVADQPDTLLRVTGFGPYGRALATPEKGTLPLPGQLVVPR